MKPADATPTPASTRSERDRRNQRHINFWALLWASTVVVVSSAIAKDSLSTPIIVTGIVVNALLGVRTLLAYRRFLQETDELRRKIEIEALAIAYGVGVVGGLSYWLLVESGAASATGFAYLFVVMLLTHGIGVHLGRRRYA